MKNRKPSILVVGTFHFESSPHDIQANKKNSLSENKQEEVQEVVEKLQNFKPTKVAVEVEKEKEDILNQQYGEYINNTFNLSSNEVHQLGFRICAKQKHKQIYAIDWMEDIGNRSIGEVLEWAQTNQMELYNLITKVYIPKITPKIKNLTILEVLKYLNQKERIQLEQELYLNVAQIGEGINYVGIDWVRWWYQRNLIIYNNIIKLIENNDDRILLLIGSAHVYLVSQFLKESGKFKLESLKPYL